MLFSYSVLFKKSCNLMFEPAQGFEAFCHYILFTKSYNFMFEQAGGFEAAS